MKSKYSDQEIARLEGDFYINPRSPKDNKAAMLMVYQHIQGRVAAKGIKELVAFSKEFQTDYLAWVATQK